MTSQADKAAAFAKLHRPGEPVVLFNIWDAGSARAVENAGAVTLATGSHSIAEALGHEDGEAAPFDDMVWMLERICASTDLPVSHDTERGYGATPDAVAQTCRRVVEAGAIGVNIEDSIDGGALRPLDQQVARLEAAKSGMTAHLPGAWLNARTDVFNAMKSASDDEKIGTTLERAAAYKAAGADSLFVPFLRDLGVISRICRDSPLPVNVMRVLDGPPIADYAAAGVARISHGPFPWRSAMALVESEARTIYTP